MEKSSLESETKKNLENKIEGLVFDTAVSVVIDMIRGLLLNEKNYNDCMKKKEKIKFLRNIVVALKDEISELED